MLNGAHGPREEFEGEQQEVHKEQEQAEHTHESDEKSPCGLDSPGPSQGERVAKHPATGQEQKALAIRRRKELERARKEERRRKQNARRLEGQKREFERKCEVRRKAEEATGAAVAAVAAGGDTSDATRAQTPNKGGPGEYPRQGEARPRRRNEEAPRAKPRREQQPQSPGVENRIPREGQVRSKQGKNPRAVAEADDQKVDTENDAAEFLGRDADAPCLIYTDREEYSVSSLMRHPTSMVSLAPPLTPLCGSSSLPLGYSDLCGPRENYQTSRESDYLFDPPQRWTTVRALTLVESAQTREDAADVLFEPPHERSGGATDTVISQAYTNPKGIMFEAGALVGAEEAVEVLEMRYPDHEQGF